jgi:hypothetical protein
MGSLYRKAGRTGWQLKYYDHGKPIYESAKTASKVEARRLLKAREAAIADRSGFQKGSWVPAPIARLTDRLAALETALQETQDRVTILERFRDPLGAWSDQSVPSILPKADRRSR